MKSRSARSELTPQMLQYAEKFDDRGDIRWMPYLMYFHPVNHRSDVVNTDWLGFRISHGSEEGDIASVGENLPSGPVRLLAGSSTVFGIGASNDGATLSSRLWSCYATGTPWLNFGGRSHNPTQELLLFILYRHLLPKIDEIVILSGFNALGLARLPLWMQGDAGAFFNCAEFFEKMDELRHGNTRRRRFRRPGQPGPSGPEERAPEEPPALEAQIDRGVEITLRHLETWRLLAQGMGARLRFVLQPLATWIREEPAPEEQRLFSELDEIGNFGRMYGEIAKMEAGVEYADRLRCGCKQIEVPFLDFNSVLANAVDPRDWLFVDRIHFNDEGHDLVARLLAEEVDVH